MHDWLQAGLGTALMVAGALLIRQRGKRDITLRREIEPTVVPPGELPVLNYEEIIERTETRQLVDALRVKLGLPVEVFAATVQPVIERYAEFVQLMPASESHHHAEPGGLLVHTLEVVGISLDLRRGQILPRGAAPEVIAEQAQRWTYAVFVAGLLHDIGKPVADLRVQMRSPDGTLNPWSPLAGSLCDSKAISYRVEFMARGARDYALHGKLPVLLLNRLVPASVLGWLAADAALMHELLACLSADKEAPAGAIVELVQRADTESVRRNLLNGSRLRFAAARRVPLIERLMAALRALLKEGGRLPLNRSGAAGWVSDGDLWFVSKRLADEVRDYLAQTAADPDGIPADNQRLFDTWQEYGALIPNPRSGGAIWHIDVVGAGYRHRLTVLRFPLRLLYAQQNEYPASMLGAIEPALLPDGEGESSSSTTAPAVISVTESLDSVDAPTNTTVAAADERPVAAVEFLEDAEEQRRSRISQQRAGGESAPRMGAAVSLPQQAVLKEDGKPSAPDAALRFMGWVQQGLADGSIRSNESGAWVHFVEEGMLLVSPRIFKEFARRFGEDGMGGGAAVDDADCGKGIQRQLLRAEWHLAAEKGVNILTYQVVRGGRAVSQLAGVVICRPERFVHPLPPANPVLVRLAGKAKAA